MKKSQMGLETIGNYAWAILIIIILGVVMAFYMYRADIFGTDSCVLQPGFACKEFEFTQKQVKVTVINDMGKNLATGIGGKLTCQAKFLDSSWGPFTYEDVYNLPVKNGEYFNFSFPPLAPEIKRASCALSISYTEDRYGAYTKTNEGRLRWKDITSSGTWPSEQCGWAGDDDWDGCDENNLVTSDRECGHTEMSLQPGPSGLADSCFDIGSDGHSLDNDCDWGWDQVPGIEGQGGTNCRDNSSNDCCVANPACFNPNLNKPGIGNDIDMWGQFWCICHDEKTTTLNYQNINPPNDINKTETDRNCGGWCAFEFGLHCTEGQNCDVNDDCETGSSCIGGKCRGPNCNNGNFNLDESDIKSHCGSLPCTQDCGGTLSGCLPCGLKRNCNGIADCASPLTCISGVCDEPRCDNNAFNMDETDISSHCPIGTCSTDCGGTASGCPGCQKNQYCSITSDCQVGLTCCPCLLGNNICNNPCPLPGTC